MSCEDIPSLLDLQNTKKHIDDFGRLMGAGEGTSTNGVTGQVRPTYNKVMSDMNSEFDTQLAGMGYTRIGKFSTGATLTNPRQTLLWDVIDGGDGQEYGWSGVFPAGGKIVPTGSTPLTTGGIAVGAWMSRFDPELQIIVFEALRRTYAEAGYNLIGRFSNTGLVVNTATDVVLLELTGIAYAYSGALPHTLTAGETPVGNPLWGPKEGRLLRDEVSPSANLKSLAQKPQVDGSIYTVTSFYSGWAPLYNHPLGGGDFVWVSSYDKAKHNGGTIVDPTRLAAWDGTQAGLSTLFTAGTGTGCFVRVITDHLDVYWFGAMGDNEADDTLVLNKCLGSVADAFGEAYYDATAKTNTVATVQLNRGFFKITDELQVPRGIKLVGLNARNHGGTRIKQYTTNKACLNLYTLFTSLSGPQYIADQQISGIMLTTTRGSAIKAIKPVGTTDFYSTGSLSINQCFFLNVLGQVGDKFAAIDVDSAERITNCTFDANQACGIKAGSVQSCSGNTFFDQARGAIALLSDRKGTGKIVTEITDNWFSGNGDTAVSLSPYLGAVCVDVGAVGYYDGLIVSDNVIGSDIGGSFGVISNGPVRNTIIADNLFSGLTGDAVKLHSAEGVKITGNKIKECGNTSNGVYVIGILNPSNNVEITGNEFKGCGGSRNIYLQPSSTDWVVSGNKQDTDRVEIPSTAGRRTLDYLPAINNVKNLGPATAWISPPLLNGWTNKPVAPLRYRRDELGYVVIEGALNGGSIGAPLANLPAGFRPRDYVSIIKVGATATSYGHLTINNVGDIYVLATSDGTAGNASIQATFYPET